MTGGHPTAAQVPRSLSCMHRGRWCVWGQHPEPCRAWRERRAHWLTGPSWPSHPRTRMQAGGKPVSARNRWLPGRWFELNGGLNRTDCESPHLERTDYFAQKTHSWVAHCLLWTGYEERGEFCHPSVVSAHGRGPAHGGLQPTEPITQFFHQ